jgi:hypothetical protein
MNVCKWDYDAKVAYLSMASIIIHLLKKINIKVDKIFLKLTEHNNSIISSKARITNS